MDIKTFTEHMTTEEKEAFAKKANTSVAYLSQLVHGHRQAGLKTILAIERASGGVVTPHDLRPDLFRKEQEDQVAWTATT
jgi:DNA-binding transcriptional regulator YdaS (Cro superfamily)